METLKLDLTENREEKIKTAADILKRGGIVAIPTETVYGLAASALSDGAVKKVFEAKGRPQDNPLIVHISSLDELSGIVEDFPENAKKAAEKFWPGPFTMILKKGNKVCESVTAGLDTVAVRMPDNEVAREIIHECGFPLAAPSANRSGYPSPTTAKHVINDLDTRIDAVVLSGDCKVGVESTVITLASNPPRLLRPGYITLEQLREIFPDIEVDKAVLSSPEDTEKVASPGMKYKHYSPKCNITLLNGESSKYADFVNSKDGVAVCFDEDLPFVKNKKISYGKRDDNALLAKNIFAVLRNLDSSGIKNAYVHSPDKSGIGLAVYNRLIRAAAFKVIDL